MSPLDCVPKRNGKHRLIIDLKNLNSFCTPNEDVRDLASILKHNDKFISLDIKADFYHIHVHPLDGEFRTLLVRCLLILRHTFLQKQTCVKVSLRHWSKSLC